MIKSSHLFILLTTLLLSLTAAQAHVPVLDTAAKPKSAPFMVDDAEHSTAIYAILTGEPDYYRIDEAEAFDFYVGLTAAKLEGCGLQQTFDIEVLDADFRVIDGRRGEGFRWWPWFEPFGRKWYWVGPEIGADFASTQVYPAGTYYIRVSNAQNRGKYVLAIGDDERFGLGTILSLPGTMRQTARQFWDESDCP